MILLFAIFNSFTIPLTLAFNDVAVDIEGNVFYEFMTWAGTFFFIIDIILQANTSYYSPEGEEITDKQKIRMHYLHGMFLVDLISSIPIELMFPGSVLRLFNILKLLRIKRLTPIINKMNVDDDNKNMLRVAHLIFLLILAMHIIACFWYVITTIEELWIIPLDFKYAGNYDKIYHFYLPEHQPSLKYVQQFYNSLLFLGGNEMGPRTTLELFLAPCIMIMLAIFNAWLFGEMAMLIEQTSVKFN